MSDSPIFDRNRRYDPAPEEEDAGGEVILADFGGGSNITIDPKTGDISTPTEDGGVMVQIDPPDPEEEAEDNTRWFRNLATKIGDYERGRIVEEVLRGIEADDQSRQQWLQTRAEGIKMLGIELEQPQGDAGSSTGPFEGMSTVRHPLLLEAIARFQANAAAELYPPSGPVKVRDDRPAQPSGVVEVPDVGLGHNGGPPMLDDSLFDPEHPIEAMNVLAADKSGREDLAEALEKGFNHNLTAVDRGYRPDSVRMLFWVGFGGCAFKKIYDCPIKQRPVSRFVDASDIIVSNAVSDHRDAGRITHRITMRPALVRRMQVAGVYRDIDLHEPQFQPDAVQEATAKAQGLDAMPQRQEDQPRTLYESYVELDIDGYEHKLSNGKPSRIPMPWKVTIDKDAREILELRRNWDEDDETHSARAVFVKYGFIPAMGFYDLGLLHLLGNGDRALTAAWRIALDTGMFNNFPGFMYNEGVIRNWTNQNRVPPGGGLGIKVAANIPLAQVLQPLPYKDVSPGLITMMQHVEGRMDRVAGTAEMPVGEGRQDAPVGTTLALIEQATKILAAVHINLHDAQAEEFQILRDRYRENPESFWKWSKLKDQPKWEREMFLRALDDYELVPAADPNTASHLHRIMKAQAVKQFAMLMPQLYDMKKVDEWCMTQMQVSDPDQFFAGAGQNDQPPDPMLMATMMTLEAKKAEVQAKAQVDMAKLEMEAASAKTEHDFKMIELAAEHQARIRESQQDAQETALESADRAADRQSEERRIMLKLFSDMLSQHQKAQNQTTSQAQQQQHQLATQARDHQFKGASQARDQQFQGVSQVVGQQHQQQQGLADRQHQVFTQGLDQQHQMQQKGLDQQHEVTQQEADREHQSEQQQATLDHQREQAKLAAKATPAAAKKPAPRKT